MLNLSTGPSDEKESRGASPQVAEVLQQLDPTVWNQSKLARASGVDRAVLNQLYRGQTSSTPQSIGRLCAVLGKADASKLLAAFFEDIGARVHKERCAVKGQSGHIPREVICVRYPPV